MNKKSKYVVGLMTLAMGLTLLSGCGKEKGMKPEDMVDKYSAMCTLGEYKGVEYVATVTEVTDEMVQAQVDSLLAKYAVSEPLESGKVQSGDTVNVDFVGTVDGVEFEGGSTQGMGADLTLGQGRMIPGFEEGIIGREVGETFDVDVTFPEVYENNPDLAGKDAVFKITINSCTRNTYPEYTDEFVASNTDASSKEEYEANTRDSLEEYYNNQNENANRTAIMTVIMNGTTINEYPEQEMQNLVDETVKSVEDEAKSYGYDLETYVMTVYGMASEDSFVDYISGMVEDYLKEKIVVCAIAKAEGIKVTDEDIEAAEKLVMEAYSIETKDELYEQYTADDITYYAIAEKVFTFLIDNGSPVDKDGNPVTLPAKEE